MIPFLNTVSTIMCPHGGRLILTTSNTQAMADRNLMLLLTDQHSIVGCPFTVGPKPQPCVLARWLVGATQCKVNGIPVLLQNSVGLCFSAEQIPQGAPIVVQTQQTAKGL